MATFNFNEFLSQKQAPVVLPGKYENVVISNYEVQTSKNSTYVRFTYKLEDGRTISDNRFEQGLKIMVSHLREQLDLQTQEITPNELFELCKEKGFSLWVERTTIFNANTGLNQRVTNINFLEPLNKTEVDEVIVPDELPE